VASAIISMGFPWMRERVMAVYRRRARFL